MYDINYFSTPSYREGQSFKFNQLQHSEWIIQSQLSQENSRASKDEVAAARERMSYEHAAGKGISYAVATFRVGNSHNREARPAYMRVYMQVPWAGTEFAEYEERSKQAASTWEHDEVTALKDFHNFGSKFTPELFAIDENIQGPQGHVPGGPVVHIVFEWVPGVRLAEDNLVPEYRNEPHPFFRDFSRTQRDEIRKCFDEGHSSLQAMGWDIGPSGGKSLVWNTEKSKM